MIQSGDIRFAASRVMADVPEGGGPPTNKLIPDGASNAIFPDIPETARATGLVELRQIHLTVRSTDTDALRGAHVIISDPPDDPNVSLTLAMSPGPFAVRTELVNRVEGYLTPAPEYSGYLLENHVVGQRSIQIFQRPRSTSPPINDTIVLVFNEGLVTERKQYVRVIRVSRETRTFTELLNGQAIDFLGDVVTCDISDKLNLDFPGSPPSRGFARQATKTAIRDTVVADSGSYSGVSLLTQPTALADVMLKVANIYSQLVPSSRTETPLLDQRPTAARTLTLATTPRLIQTSSPPHSQRIFVTQETRGFSYTFVLSPRPAPGTVTVSWLGLGNWETITDDGVGGLSGQGVGTINYLTGSMQVTLPSLPDPKSSVIVQWSDTAPYTNRTATGSPTLLVRAPEFSIDLGQSGVNPASVTIAWLSGGAAQSATVNASAQVTGAATGSLDAASGVLYLQPNLLPDTGTTFTINFDHRTMVSESLLAVSPDAGGFANVTFTQQPQPGTVRIRWATAQAVSNTSGGTMAQEVPGFGEVIQTVTYPGAVSQRA